jgi:hypothetical protein
MKGNQKVADVLKTLNEQNAFTQAIWLKKLDKATTT